MLRLPRLALPILLACATLAALPGCAPATDPAAAAFGPALPAEPPALAAALSTFRAEGPKGWAFTQTTAGGGKDRVERFDPRQRGNLRWTLLNEKGRPPTPEEQQRYRDTRPATDSAANIVAQLDRSAVALVSSDSASSTYEYRLKPGGEHDTAAAHMRARFTLDHASGSFTRVEMFNFEPFKAASSLIIEEARTTLLYDLPAEGRPALPREVSLKVRGQRFWIRDFEQNITSTFSDHEDATHASAP